MRNKIPACEHQYLYPSMQEIFLPRKGRVIEERKIAKMTYCFYIFNNQTKGWVGCKVHNAPSKCDPIVARFIPRDYVHG